MNLDFAAPQENIDACDAQIAASAAVLGAMDDAMQAAAMREAMRSVIREHFVAPLMKLIADSGVFASGGMIGGASSTGFLPASLYPMFGVDLASGPDMTAYTVVGSLPTRAEMEPAVRSVVQSVAADLLKLPVREMNGGGSGSAPIAGLTRTATDGERNGRMAWVPGARS